jgi:hypothetical protein
MRPRIVIPAKAGIQILSRFSGPFIPFNTKYKKSAKARKTCSRSEWQDAGEDSRREKTGQPQLFLLRGGDGRDVAQPGRALRSGRRGRWFESSRPDHVHFRTLNQLACFSPDPILLFANPRCGCQAIQTFKCPNSEPFARQRKSPTIRREAGS